MAAAAQTPTLGSRDLAVQLAVSVERNERELAAHIARLPVELLAGLATDPAPSVRRAVAHRRDLPASVQRVLVDDPATRSAMAANRSLAQAFADELIATGDPQLLELLVLADTPVGADLLCRMLAQMPQLLDVVDSHPDFDTQLLDTWAGTGALPEALFAACNAAVWRHLSDELRRRVLADHRIATVKPEQVGHVLADADSVLVTEQLHALAANRGRGRRYLSDPDFVWQVARNRHLTAAQLELLAALMCNLAEQSVYDVAYPLGAIATHPACPGTLHHELARIAASDRTGFAWLEAHLLADPRVPVFDAHPDVVFHAVALTRSDVRAAELATLLLPSYIAFDDIARVIGEQVDDHHVAFGMGDADRGIARLARWLLAQHPDQLAQNQWLTNVAVDDAFGRDDAAALAQLEALSPRARFRVLDRRRQRPRAAYDDFVLHCEEHLRAPSSQRAEEILAVIDVEAETQRALEELKAGQPKRGWALLQLCPNATSDQLFRACAPDLFDLAYLRVHQRARLQPDEWQEIAPAIALETDTLLAAAARTDLDVDVALGWLDDEIVDRPALAGMLARAQLDPRLLAAAYAAVRPGERTRLMRQTLLRGCWRLPARRREYDPTVQRDGLRFVHELAIELTEIARRQGKPTRTLQQAADLAEDAYAALEGAPAPSTTIDALL